MPSYISTQQLPILRCRQHASVTLYSHSSLVSKLEGYFWRLLLACTVKTKYFRGPKIKVHCRSWNMCSKDAVQVFIIDSIYIDSKKGTSCVQIK